MSWNTHITITATNSSGSPETKKQLFFSDRNAAFASTMHKLSKPASIESLGFISEIIERIDSGVFMGEYTDKNCCQHTTINPDQFDILIDDIDRFFLWCKDNISETCLAFRDYGSSEDDISNGIARAGDYCIEQHDGDDSGSPDYLFCALKSMQNLFKYAKKNTLIVEYENIIEC